MNEMKINLQMSSTVIIELIFTSLFCLLFVNKRHVREKGEGGHEQIESEEQKSLTLMNNTR